MKAHQISCTCDCACVCWHMLSLKLNTSHNGLYSTLKTSSNIFFWCVCFTLHSSLEFLFSFFLSLFLLVISLLERFFYHVHPFAYSRFFLVYLPSFFWLFQTLSLYLALVATTLPIRNSTSSQRSNWICFIAWCLFPLSLYTWFFQIHRTEVLQLYTNEFNSMQHIKYFKKMLFFPCFLVEMNFSWTLLYYTTIHILSAFKHSQFIFLASTIEPSEKAKLFSCFCASRDCNAHRKGMRCNENMNIKNKRQWQFHKISYTLGVGAVVCVACGFSCLCFDLLSVQCVCIVVLLSSGLLATLSVKYINNEICDRFFLFCRCVFFRWF